MVDQVAPEYVEVRFSPKEAARVSQVLVVNEAEPQSRHPGWGGGGQSLEKIKIKIKKRSMANRSGRGGIYSPILL